MPARDEPVVVAREWLRFAEQDRTASRAALAERDEFEPRHVCFSAQQAVEKAVKALYVLRSVPFPFSHDLAMLVRSLPAGAVLSVASDELEWLTQWATSTRYPGGEEPTWADAERAAMVADRVVGDVRASLT